MVIKRLATNGVNDSEAEPLVFGAFLISIVVFIVVSILWLCSDYPCFGITNNNYDLVNNKYSGHNVILETKTKEKSDVIINYNGNVYKAVK